MRPTSARIRHGVTTTTALVGSVSLAFTATPAAAQALATAHTPSAAHPGLRLAVTVPPPTATLRALETAPAEVTVVPGDTVSDIAARWGLATADVLAWNGLDWSSIIHPGQRLRLAPPAGGANVTPAATPAPAAEAAPATAVASHTVTGGDTLWAIAQDAGVGLAALLEANGLERGSIIYPGQTLLIPGAGGAQPAAAAPAAPAPAEASPAPAPAPAPATPPAAAAPVVLDAEQIENARIIIEVGRSRGVSERGIAIALATGMVESWLRNLDWGDRDSLGLFQQRPSTGWGTEDEVRDPYRAAAAFFGGPDDPNGTATRGLLDVPGWEAMDFGAAAQAVQISAHPERYGPWEQQAEEWLATLG